MSLAYMPGNRLELLENGVAYFSALAAAVHTAIEEVMLETYIFADDQSGSLVCAALARAAARGVKVRLLIDGFGAKDFAPRFRHMLEQAGAEVLVFRPDISLFNLRLNRMRRMHRKLASIDGRIGFVGGINIIDDYHTPGHTPPRLDYAVRIEGPLALEIRRAAHALWGRVAWATLGRRWPGLGRRRAGGQETASLRGEITGRQFAALALRDSLRHRRDIEDGYLGLIDGAREEILIACAYFFPGRRFRDALIAAARRGVAVRLLLQGRVEYMLLHYATRGLYGELLEAGITIHEYHKSFLHAKVAVFDRRIASVGSSNIDPFSLLLAREANVFVDDAAFAGALRASLERVIADGALPVLPRTWRGLSWFARLPIRAGYAMARLFLAVYGLERYH